MKVEIKEPAVDSCTAPVIMIHKDRYPISLVVLFIDISHGIVLQCNMASRIGKIESFIDYTNPQWSVFTGKVTISN